MVSKIVGGVLGMLVAAAGLVPAAWGGDPSPRGSASPDYPVSDEWALDARQLYGGLRAHRAVLTPDGVAVDRRNQTQPASSARITTDVIDLGREAILSRPIDVREVCVSLDSNAGGRDRVSVELRSGSSYFQRPGTWSDWGPARRVDAPGRYIQLRIRASTDRDDFRITGARIDVVHAPRPEFATPVTLVDNRVQRIVRSTIPFGYQRPDHPDLTWLRETFQLDRIVAKPKTEFEKVNALCTWVSSRSNDRHDRWNTLPYYPWNARRLMDEKEGGTIYGHCASYCAVFVACCNSLGWHARHFAIEGYKRNSHETAEVYIRELGRWIYFDPSLATYFVDRETGDPLDTLQMHDIYLATHFNRPGDTVPEIEEDYDELARERAAIDWDTFPARPVSRDWIYGRKGPWHWTGAQGLMTTAWLQMTPRSDFYDRPTPVYRQFGGGPTGSNGFPVWVDDQTPPRTAETRNFFTRRRDFYWTLDQAGLRLVRTGENRVTVELGNSRPFFRRYRVTIDGADRTGDTDPLTWRLRPGENRLTVDSEDTAGRPGAASHVAVRLGSS